MRGVLTEPVQVFADRRGSLHKLLPRAVSGEVYLVRARPGARRGDHLHRRMGEWFTAISGRGLLRVAEPGGAWADYSLEGRRVYVPAGLAHALIATGSEDFVVLALADRAHDPNDVVPCPAGPR